MLYDESDWMEIGSRASWAVSTAKPGNGVELMRDDSVKTFWQSDGHQPHLIDIKFSRKTHILEVQLYIDYRQDESYTPNRISIRAGNSHSDLKVVAKKDFHEPRGWQKISFQQLNAGFEAPEMATVFKAKRLQIAILSNHQNGRDSHVRQIRIFGPTRDPLDLIADGPPQKSRSVKAGPDGRGRCTRFV